MQNSLHFINRFDIIAKRSKLVWLSRQSDSLVMNRSAVRIRPPAPQNPLGKRAGFLFSVGGFLPFADASMRPARLRVQINRRISAIPSRKRSLRIRPPAPHRRRKATVADARLLTGILHPLLRLLFASRKCKTFAVLLVPTELPHCSLIFAPRGGFAAFLRAGFLFSVGGFLPFADEVLSPHNVPLAPGQPFRTS